jgi:hypothetical protein
MARSPEFYVGVVIASLTAYVVFTMLMMGFACD